MQRDCVTRAVVLLGAAVTTAGADVVLVPQDHPTIQAAIHAAAWSDEIVVGPGVYPGNLNLLGKPVTLRSTEGPGSTVIVGSGVGSVVVCDSGETPDTRIIGFTITGGIDEGSFDGGGGLHTAANASPTIVDCIITGNTAYVGGGVRVEGPATLIGCLIAGNSAPFDANQPAGGGASVSGGGTLIACEIRDNACEGRLTPTGGGLYLGAAHLFGCVIEGNTTNGDGGGVAVYRDAAEFVNCLIVSNVAGGSGGGVFHCENLDAELSLVNCTIVANVAEAGGAVFFEHDAAGTGSVQIQSCILWDHAGGAIAGARAPGEVTVDHSNVQDGFPGSGNIDVDPGFADAGAGDYRLTAGSPCIDAGNSAGLPECRLDLDGAERVVDDPDVVDSGAGPDPYLDMGAYEFGAPRLDDCQGDGRADACEIDGGLVPDCDDDGTPDGCQLAGQDCNGNGQLDACDIAGGLPDRDGNGVPDGCELVNDCNANGIDDDREIADDPGLDADGSGELDACELNVPSEFATIQAAIDASTDGDRVSVAPGVYVEQIDFLDRSIIVSGAGGAEVATIDGQGPGPVVNCAGGQGPGAVLEGFTVTGSTGEAGGMLIIGASPTVRGCRFVGNVGSGMSIVDGHPAVVDCDFIDNEDDGGPAPLVWGGGLFSAGTSAPVIVGCRFIGNRAIAPSGTFSSGRGGGLYARNATILDCEFRGNIAGGDCESRGGGLDVQGFSTVRRCLIEDNTVLIPDSIEAEDAGRGGGLFSDGLLEMSECHLIGNMATRGAGAYVGAGGGIDTSLIVNCEFLSNVTLDPGGSPHPRGGGLHASGESVTVTNCSFGWNVSQASQGAIYLGPINSFVARNCIIWFNEPVGFFEGSIEYCNIEGGFAGEGNIDADPMFLAAEENLRLHPDSPCIDAGQNSALPETVTVDLDGNPRFRDRPETPDSGDGTPPLVDMGAYEFQPDCPGDVNGDGSVDVDDLVAIILAWDTPDGDVNGDGVTDVLDLIEAILGWGPCA